MSWLISVKMAVLAPIPRARETTATARKTGDLRSVRKEYWKSCRIAAIDPYTARIAKSYEILTTSLAKSRCSFCGNSGRSNQTLDVSYGLGAPDPEPGDSVRPGRRDSAAGMRLTSFSGCRSAR